MTGQTISHYRIADQLGRGGMGIVYRAEDTKLNRTVALKLLPPHALASEDDRARFYREARAAAALSHPNIAHVYEIDEAVAGGETRPFIAMEFIDGETLSDRIARGPLPIDDAISIATQIAEGLKAAHDKDIVHRDIKSGNVMITKSGVVKILDFGLAKTAASTKLTQLGSTLGTVAYMSPEQAKGEEVDRRTDIWSVGVILYEMISGQLPFKGDYEQAVIYAILNADPEALTAIRAGVPMGLDGVVAKLLAKDRGVRYQHVDELPADLKSLDMQSSPSSRLSVAHHSKGDQRTVAGDGLHRRFWPTTLVVPVTVALVVLAFFLGWFSKTQETTVEPLRKMTVVFPEMQSIAFPALSPASKWIAFSGVDTLGRKGVFLYEMATGSIRHIEGSDLYDYARFSPSGEKLLLGRFCEGSAVLELPDGVARRIENSGCLHAWESDDTIIVSSYDGPTEEYSTEGIYRHTISDGSTRLVARQDSALAGTPWALALYVTDVVPGGLAIGGAQSSGAGRHALAVVDLQSGTVAIGEEGVGSPRFVPGGFLAYQSGSDWGKILVRAIDVPTAEFTASPIEVLPSIRYGAVDVGIDGSLIYAPLHLLEEGGLFEGDLTKGPVKLTRLLTQTVGEPALSNAGHQIAVQVFEGGNIFVAVFDRRSNTLSRRTFGPERLRPAWSADDNFLYYDDRNNIYRRPADGTGSEELVLEEAWGADIDASGRWMVAAGTGSRGRILIAMDLESRSVSVLDSTSAAYRPAISSSGRYVSYEVWSEGSGLIAVRPVEGDGYWMLGSNGEHPTWSSDQRHIYFRDFRTGISRLPVRVGSAFETAGEPETVFQAAGYQEFDLHPSGTNIVVAARALPANSDTADRATLVLWQNWAQSLTRETAP